MYTIINAQFNTQFMKQWNYPEDVEKLRKQEEEKKYNRICKINMKILENCIKYNAIENLDRTKLYDKTFICKNFISKSEETWMQNEEIKHFAHNVKYQIKELGIEYTYDKNNILIENSNRFMIKYVFPSNFIPKNTFTTINDSFIFRISNNKIEDNVQHQMMEIIENIC